MSTDLQFFGDSNVLARTEFSNPFKKQCIKNIWLSCFPNATYRKPEEIVEGTVKFEKGMTKGEQTFKGKDFASVLSQMYSFCAQL